MNLNENLIKFAGFNPTKQTQQITVVNLCQKIEEKEITLPLYQRDVCWTLEKCVSLLNYQLLGKAPVSPISINKVNKKNSDVIQIDFLDRNVILDVENEKLSVTDGQQRLTTNYKAYINHEDFKNIVLDLIKGSFIIEKHIKKNQIPVGILLNKDSAVFSKYIMGNSMLKKSECMSLLYQIRSKLHDYSYTVNLAEKLTESEQILWFEVLNNAGSRVTRVQMKLSKLKLYGIDIYNEYTRKFVEIIQKTKYMNFEVKTTEVSIPIATLNSAYELISKKEHSQNFTPIASDVRENQICSLSPEQLKEAFERTLEALNEAINFIKKNKLEVPDRIDYITYLTGFFVFNNKEKIKLSKKEKIIDWYKNVKFYNKSNSERRRFFSELLAIK